jgi:hypothetical protein
VQIEAARIVCGFPSYASIASIYKETGWDKLKVRREVKNNMFGPLTVITKNNT